MSSTILVKSIFVSLMLIVVSVRLIGILGPGKVTSWLRSVQRNKEVGGVKNSRHLFGMALDIIPNTGETLREIFNFYQSLPFGDTILEKDYVHWELF